jgi:hypothetical protein
MHGFSQHFNIITLTVMIELYRKEYLPLKNLSSYNMLRGLCLDNIYENSSVETSKWLFNVYLLV